MFANGQPDPPPLCPLLASGGGLQELSGHFENQKVMYGFCSVKDSQAALPKYVLINWVCVGPRGWDKWEDTTGFLALALNLACATCVSSASHVTSLGLHHHLENEVG